MELVLQQNQTLQLVMTTELRQAIAILQYSTYELYQFIQEQNYENPLIELKEHTPDDTFYKPSSRVNYGAEDEVNPIDFLANEEQNMFAQLLEQLKWLHLNDQERKLLHYLILNLDENALLPLENDEIAADLSISSAEVMRGIELLQTLEPVGIGARNVAESLALQLKHYYPEEEQTAHIVKHDLKLLASKKWKELSASYDLRHEDLQRIYELIRTLDPNPGQMFKNEQTYYVEPDIIIKEQEGKFIVYLNDSYIPEIRFNSDYLPLINKKDDLSPFVQKNYKQYQWLIKSIEQRRMTILKITEVIVRRQQAFLKEGFSFLKPLTLDEVAQEIEMHESTVSRATTNKMIQTPIGLFDMRQLFSSKMKNMDGTLTSQTKIKWLLKELIEKEDKIKPMSDQKIAEYFKGEQQIKISRRTIAKYREELKIQSSRERKELSI